MARIWTNKEREAWANFIYGGVMFPPGNRSPAAVLTRLGASGGRESLLINHAFHSRDALHAGSTAALAVLRTQPFRLGGNLLERADAVVAFCCGDVVALDRMLRAETTRHEAEIAGRAASFDFGPNDNLEAFQAEASDVLHAAVIACRAAIQSVRRAEAVTENLDDAA